jgi:hypothetical protein
MPRLPIDRNRLAKFRPTSRPEARAFAAIQVVNGPLLCEIRFWTEAEWDALPDGERPEDCAHKPGLGWIGAVPTVFLN